MQEETARRLVGLRIKEARKAAKISQKELAEKLGLKSQSVISDWERGELKSWRDHLEAVCDALGQPASYFATPSNNIGGVNTFSVREIPVVGEVRGGDFRMAFEVPPDRREMVSVAWTPPVSNYPAQELRALKVVGPSVNMVFPEGFHVIVVRATETDVRPGDFVVVFRRQGELCETTVKQLQYEAGRWVLYPRSTHPEHQEPIYLEENGQDSPEIAYVVVGVSPTYERPPAPVAFPLKR